MKQVLFLLLITAMAVTACRSSKTIATNTHKAVAKKDSTRSFVDTTKKVTTTVSEVQTFFGDTLKATLGFTDAQIVQMDSSANATTDEVVESNGIKVSVRLQRFNGGIKANIKAIAKPTNATNTNTKKVEEKAGVTEQTKVTTNLQIKDTKRDVAITGFPWNTVIIVIGSIVLLILGLLIYKYRKHLP